MEELKQAKALRLYRVPGRLCSLVHHLLSGLRVSALNGREIIAVGFEGEFSLAIFGGIGYTTVRNIGGHPNRAVFRFSCTILVLTGRRWCFLFVFVKLDGEKILQFLMASVILPLVVDVREFPRCSTIFVSIDGIFHPENRTKTGEYGADRRVFRF